MNITESNDAVAVLRQLERFAVELGEGVPDPVLEAAVRLAERAGKTLQCRVDLPGLVEHADPDERCASCGARCSWVDDAWACGGCGDEWPPSGPSRPVVDVVVAGGVL